MTFSIKCEAQRVSQILELIPLGSKRICEIGIGYGHVAIPASKAFPMARVFGVESPGRKYLHNAAYQNLMLSNLISIWPFDITQPWPFQDDFFDVAIFGEVAEHIPPTCLPFVLAEIRRCLKGTIILTTPNLLRLRNRIRFVLGRPLFASPSESFDGTFGHLREYSHDEIIQFLQDAGFNSIAQVRHNLTFPFLQSNMRDRTISMIGKGLAMLNRSFEDFVITRALSER